MVPGHLPGPEKAVNKNSRRPPAVFVVSNLKILVLQGAEIRLGGAGRDALEGIVPKGPAVGAGGHDALLVTDHLLLVQGAAAGAVDTAGLDLLLKQGQRGHLPCHRYWKLPLLYPAGVRFSTAFFHPPDGQQEEEEPHAPGGDRGDGQGLVEVQGGQSLSLLGQIGGHRGVQGKQPGQQAQQGGGEQAVE